ncbi:hypothetical protein HYQ46_012153 [Verticillium longisporum]|nr:hypothetical protein HYQ46_012153 [Verticillium longisporum]
MSDWLRGKGTRHCLDSSRKAQHQKAEPSSWAGHHAATSRPNMPTRAPAPTSDAWSYRQATKGLQEIVG